MRSFQCDPYFVALSREIPIRGMVAARTNGGLRREGRRLVLCGGGRAALTPCVSATVAHCRASRRRLQTLLASDLCARICEVFEAVGARVALELRQRAFVQVESAERYERSVENSRSRTNHPTNLSV